MESRQHNWELCTPGIQTKLSVATKIVFSLFIQTGKIYFFLFLDFFQIFKHLQLINSFKII